MGFEQPEDFLNAEDMGETIRTLVTRYFEDDQIGKSNEILHVIIEYAAL
jgi:hypothetical protein